MIYRTGDAGEGQAAIIAVIEAAAGAAVSSLAQITQPWPSSTETFLATMRDGHRYIVQRSSSLSTIRRRARIARSLARTAPWLPIPQVIASVDAPPLLVTTFVSGRPGRELLGVPGGAERLGQLMGGLVVSLRRVPVTRLRLNRTWSDKDRLSKAAITWMGRARPWLPFPTISAVELAIEHIRAAPEADPVFAHGDFAPVNVILDDGQITGLIDFERARLAHPLFDFAWWSWIIRVHHSDAWDLAKAAFVDAAGLNDDLNTNRTAHALGVLQMLEIVARAPASHQAWRRLWADRLSVLADSPR
jgi:aminoglycoside phosphotransferase (APT) family kinase protein